MFICIYRQKRGAPLTGEVINGQVQSVTSFLSAMEPAPGAGVVLVGQVDTAVTADGDTYSRPRVGGATQ